MYEGELKMKPVDYEDDVALVPVAILEYSLAAMDLELHKGACCERYTSLGGLFILVS